MSGQDASPSLPGGESQSDLPAAVSCIQTSCTSCPTVRNDASRAGRPHTSFGVEEPPQTSEAGLRYGYRPHQLTFVYPSFDVATVPGAARARDDRSGEVMLLAACELANTPAGHVQQAGDVRGARPQERSKARCQASTKRSEGGGGEIRHLSHRHSTYWVAPGRCPSQRRLTRGSGTLTSSGAGPVARAMDAP